MTRDETKTIIRAMMATYPSYKPENLAETIDVWTMVLDDVDYKAISSALKSYIRDDRSGFAPSIGQLMEYTRQMTSPEELNPHEAWGLVRRALANSAYNSVSEYQKLPKQVQEAVGSPDNLRAMAISEDFNESVESSQFIRIYNTVIARDRERAKMSPDVRRLIDQVNIGSEKNLLQQRNESLMAEAPELTVVIESSPMPERCRERLNEIFGGAF